LLPSDVIFTLILFFGKDSKLYLPESDLTDIQEEKSFVQCLR